MTQSAVSMQVDPESVPTTPSWMGEAAAFAQVLNHTGILKAIQEHMSLFVNDSVILSKGVFYR